uniref:Uncharacterized protein n=1 Tax=Rhipicephalus appendiculatus TaxID=34631 RepID=A0A131YGE8_RHIAP
MHVARPSIRCLLGLLFVLYTLVQGPSYVFAGTAKPGLDPLYYFKGRLGGARPPRRYPNLPTIREEGPPPPSDSTSGNDPLYYFPGSLGIARPPRIRRSLPIIPEGGSGPARPGGREQLMMHPHLRGSGPPPLTEFLHQGSSPPNQGPPQQGPAPQGPNPGRRPFLLPEYHFMYGRPG